MRRRRRSRAARSNWRSSAAWSLTRAEGLLDGLPQVLSGRVDAMIDEIDAAEAALDQALARQFALTGRAAGLAARIEAGRAAASAAIADIDRRLLARDAPPLWRGLGTDTHDARAAMWRGLAIEEQFAVDYHAAGTGNQQALSTAAPTACCCWR